MVPDSISLRAFFLPVQNFHRCERNVHHIFSKVVLGAIVARYWNRDFAKGTLRPFETICNVFEEAAGSSIQPLNSLVRRYFSRFYSPSHCRFIL
jgi:hypothetical protein